MIKFYNRKKQTYETELVAGENYLNWIYSSPIGMKFLEIFIKKKLFSKIYGWYCDRNSSKSKIKNFVSELNIDMSISQTKLSDFTSFNDFFTRKLAKDARPISNDLMSPGDGRLLAYENIDLENIIQVKGINYSLRDLIKEDSVASKYKNGTCLVLRLCPTDYHRFHFLDSGTCSKVTKINGFYYSVNPIALKKVKKLFCENKREWSILHSDNFKDVLYIEVGATCVGTIIQTYTPDTRVEKGDEKGYFKFGGSTIVLFLEKGAAKIDEDILEQTKLGYETQVLMGETIGRK